MKKKKISFAHAAVKITSWSLVIVIAVVVFLLNAAISEEKERLAEEKKNKSPEP